MGKAVTTAVTAAARELDRTNWAIGDALLTECPRDGRHSLRQVVKELQEHGVEGFSVNRLAKLRNVAEAFPESTRRYELAWATHAAAETPETLNEAIRQRDAEQR